MCMNVKTGKNYRQLVFILGTLILSVNNNALAQDSTNADGLYSMARAAAFDSKNYEEALRLSHKALQLTPNYTDILVFRGRVFTWNKQSDSARHSFRQAIRQKPGLEDTYAAYADVEYWEKNYEAALDIIEEGLSVNNNSQDLLIRKARILYAAKEYKTAAVLVDTLISIDRKNTEVRTLANLIKDNISVNKIGIRFDYINFDKQFADPWQLAGLYYTRQTKYGPVTARLNYANRFKQEGIQYELESYPAISKTFYSYINIGYSDNVGVLPRWRGGASLYANLPKAFEAAAGVRYLYFTSGTYIYMLYAGKYYKNFLLGAQTFLTPVSANISETYSFVIRYYYKDIEDYIGLNIGGGISPDDRKINIQINDPYKLRTYSGELTIQHAIRRLNIIVVNISLVNQEYRPQTIGNQIQIGMGYTRRF